jgi:hypothetical protein
MQFVGPAVTTLAADTIINSVNAYGNWNFNSWELALQQKITGTHSLTIIGGTPTNWAPVIINNGANDFSGGLNLNGAFLLDNPSAYAVSGATLSSHPLGLGAVTIAAGSFFNTSDSHPTYTIPQMVTLNGNVTFGLTQDTNGNPANYYGATASFDSTMLTQQNTFTIVGNPTITVNGTSGNPFRVAIKDQVLGTGFSKAGPGILTINNLPANQTVNVLAGTLALGVQASAGKVNPLAALNITAGATVDIGNQGLVLDSATGADYTSVVSSLTSSSTDVGMVTGAQYKAANGPTIDGITVTNSQVIYKYTYLGDATLDGKVTATDYAQIDASYLLQTQNPTWFQGNFTHNATPGYTVGAADYAAIDAGYSAYLGGGPLAAAQVALDAARFGAAFTTAYNALIAPAAVPEPTSLALLGLGAVTLLRRRR